MIFPFESANGIDSTRSISMGMSVEASELYSDQNVHTFYTERYAGQHPARLEYSKIHDS